MAAQDKSINYIELPMTDVEATKAFYGGVFGWTFTDWGPQYISFDGAGIDGGFDGSGEASPHSPGVLVVLYAEDLPSIQQAILRAKGKILQPIYEFPGGKRFHFQDPNGNELAVWSDR
ncbi:VOC family protein [Rhodovibrionaceae bacterium A322]